LFVGAKGKLEMEKVPAAGYAIEGLWISGLQRRMTMDNLSFPFKVISSLVRSGKILNRFKPDVVVGVGGYASGPVLRKATGYKIPTLIQEQNSYAGLTNRILGKRVNKICVAYDHMGRYFPEEKIVLTGNPVRQDIVRPDAKRKEAMEYFGLNPNAKTLLVMGGSMGARAINESILSGLDDLLYHNLQVIWQVGKFYHEEMLRRLGDKGGEQLKVVAFLERMDLAYAAADMVISRAGALAISELCLVGKPVILVPSSNVAEDHQTKNALALEEKKAAILVRDIDATKQLAREAIALMNRPDKQKEMSENIRSLGKPDAAKAISREVIGLIT
jgi:UDP-N-acetylglucosamine--N-acetylmuramyl-(pentapeptide) pyrophosphoryl-undecaprenol N-acetylglucosamine transferase